MQPVPMPGIYWIGGGGLRSRRRIVVTLGPTSMEHRMWRPDGGGILIFNSQLPAAAEATSASTVLRDDEVEAVQCERR
jgi:hypothetical protein